MSTKRALASSFAAAMAGRLDQIVPAGLSVCSVGASVDVCSSTAERHGSAASDILDDDDGRSLPQRIETAAQAILGGVQDAAMELLEEQWPLDSSGGVAYPAARVDGDQLLMWFGEARAPVLVVQALTIRDLLHGAA